MSVCVQQENVCLLNLMLTTGHKTGLKELQLRTLREQQLDLFFVQPGTKDSFMKKWKDTTKIKPTSGFYNKHFD